MISSAERIKKIGKERHEVCECDGWNEGWNIRPEADGNLEVGLYCYDEQN